MRYTPLATDAHGGLCPMPTEAYALCPLLAPHVTEKGYTSSLVNFFYLLVSLMSDDVT